MMATSEPPGDAHDGLELTIAEAARHFGVSQKTIRRWIKAGRIHAVLEEGRFGPQYRVLLPDEAPEPTTISREATAIAAVVSERLEERQAAIQHEIAALREQIDGLTRAVESLVQTAPNAESRAAAAPARPRWRILGAR